MMELAGSSVVEVAVHPDGEEEYRYLMSEEYGELIRGIPLAAHADW
jgi:hypothetical protein